MRRGIGHKSCTSPVKIVMNMCHEKISFDDGKSNTYCLFERGHAGDCKELYERTLASWIKQLLQEIKGKTCGEICPCCNQKCGHPSGHDYGHNDKNLHSWELKPTLQDAEIAE